MNKCKFCSKETNNPKYCSRSCAAKQSNKEFPRRKIITKCKKCDNLIRTWRDKYCELHFEEMLHEKQLRCKEIKLIDYWNKKSINGKHQSWKNSHIREFNRRWNKDLKKKPCENCGYTKHVELAHIKSINQFDENATLGEINHPNNVIQLCPNCHWELDNGLIKISDILMKK